MRRAMLVIVAIGALVAPSAALAKDARAEWFEPWQITYLDTYERCWKAFDSRCGANLVDDTNAPRARVEESTARMRAWLNPPEPAPVTAAPTTATYAPASSGSCPANMAGEASSPSAVNTSSGASGCYQVIPSTAAAMGPACADVNALSCMQAICAAQGNDAWDAADPC